ncbi:sensor domain-containing diguanylate cyclase [Thioalkalivibrio sp. ALJT]|uniref:sensor domain-containing diguanylate cyclase n=1 Tax=Thioalkalivibrio sp. ALJT TaxID=1158146 RepID=UPI0003704101|nr:sensor domain-containing diguanylate cyclase [Thioalkalivibrio sp. ALJT]
MSDHNAPSAEDRRFWLQAIIDSSNVGTWEWNVQTGEVRLNERWAGMLGYCLEDLQPVSIDTWRALAHPEDLLRCEAALEAHFQGDTEFYHCDARMRHRDGSWIWIRGNGRVVTRTQDGLAEWIAGSHNEITDIRKTRADLANALVESQALARQLDLVQSIGRLGYWRGSLVTGELYWSDVIYEIFGVDKATFTPSVEAFKAAVHPDDLPAVEASERRASETGLHDVVHRIIRPGGEIRWVHELADMHPRGDQRTLLGTVRDITEQKELELRLRRLSNTDALTGLYSRRYFMEQLEKAFAEFHAAGTPTSVVMLDFDHFKSINDRYGHAAGDLVLQLGTRCITEHIRTSDVPARLGGEEFAVLLPEADQVVAARLALDITTAIADLDLSATGARLSTSITCGVATLRPDDDSINDIMKRADRALYRGKAAGRNQVISAA